MHIRSPRWVSRFALSASGWESLRNAFSAHLYPHGVPAVGVDSVDVDYSGGDITKPSGCATIDRYTINSPGQRSGGSVQHTYLLRNSSPNGKLIVWLCGHSGWSTYADANNALTLQALLAAHYDVLVCDMPLFEYAANPVGMDVVVGGTWSYSSGWSNSGGTLTNYPTYHDFSAVDSDGGPMALLLFLHHLVLSTNAAVASLNPSKLILAGHSGGGIMSHFLGAIDGRFDAVFTNCPGMPLPLGGTPVGAIVDWEQCALNPCYLRGPMIRDIWGVLRLAASWPGRVTDLVSALNDEYWPPTSVDAWNDLADAISEHVAVTGASFTYYLDQTEFPGHVMNTSRIARMVALMGAV